FSTRMTALFGASKPRAEVNLVMDLYRGILGVLPDNGGFGYWLGRIRAAQCGGQSAVVSEVDQISQLFITSQQYQARDNARPAASCVAMYVGDLYNAFLRRGGDLDGYKF